MARADLLIDLLKSAINNNKQMIRKVSEAIIAEERGKQHTVLADKLEEILNTPSTDNTILNNNSTFNRINPEIKAENLIVEISPSEKIQ